MFLKQLKHITALSLTTMFIIALSGAQARSQTIRITGKVVTEKAEPISEASVSLNRKNDIVRTDEAGYFTLTASLNDSVLITAVSYINQIIPCSRFTEKAAPLIIQLRRDVHALDQVIVSSGYQTLPKERSTGSFAVIKSSMLEEQVNINLIEKLESIASSMSVGRKNNITTPQLMIRGLSTINAETDPLVILDNFPYEGNLENINPNDVESITILKDAAAASIWGARAGNGVIVITTKKGKLNQPITIEVNSSVQITDVPNLSYQKTMKASDIIDVEKFLFSKGYRFSDTLSGDKLPFSEVYEVLFKERNGQISANEANSILSDLSQNDVRNDFKKYFYQKSVNQQYALNIKGGSESIAWIFSAGIDNNKDQLNAGLKRINLRNSNMMRVSKKLTVETGINFTQFRTESGKPDPYTIRQIRGGLPIYTQLADQNGNPLPFYKDYRQTFVDTAGSDNIPDWHYYPLNDYKHQRTNNQVIDIVGNLGLTFDLFKGMRLIAKYQYERQQSTGRMLADEESYYARDLTNKFYQPGLTGTAMFPIPKGGIMDISNSTLISQNIRWQLNYNREWAKNSIVFLAGAEMRDLKSQGTGLRYYGYNDLLGTYSNVNYAESFRNFVNGYQSFIESNQALSENLNRFVSLFANAAYTYSGRYSLSLSARKDASNTFGVRTNKKWTPLWSAGLSWEISRERFYQISALPWLRFRLTYGYSGNVDPSLAAVTTIHYGANSPYTMTPFSEVDNYENPELRWEKSRQINFGIDFSTAQNRISGSIEIYQKRGTDLYAPALIDYTTGLGGSAIKKNVASMVAKGADVEISSRNLTGNFSWNTNLVFSFYTDKVTNYYLNSLQGSRFVGDGIAISGLTGKPVHSVFSYKWAGLDPTTGDPQGYDHDKQITKDYYVLTGRTISIEDLVYHGQAFPKIFGSIGNTFSWKSLSLSVRLMYKFGHYFKRPTLSYTSLFVALDGHPDFYKRWQQPGDEVFTNVPSMGYPINSSRESFYQNSEVLVEKADHIRLKYVTLSYDFSKKISQRLLSKNIKFYINLSDLGILWRSNGDKLDPDYTNNAIPPSRSYAIGIKANF